jgi:hypothetical protein
MVPQTLIGKEIAGWNFGWNVLDFKQIVTEDCSRGLTWYLFHATRTHLGNGINVCQIRFKVSMNEIFYTSQLLFISDTVECSAERTFYSLQSTSSLNNYVIKCLCHIKMQQ